MNYPFPADTKKIEVFSNYRRWAVFTNDTSQQNWLSSETSIALDHKTTFYLLSFTILIIWLTSVVKQKVIETSTKQF